MAVVGVVFSLVDEGIDLGGSPPVLGSCGCGGLVPVGVVAGCCGCVEMGLCGCRCGWSWVL